MGSGYGPGHGELPEDEVFVLVAAVRVDWVSLRSGWGQKFEVRIVVLIETFLLILFHFTGRMLR
jgi:hypothetical protein